ncbi:OLC1v1011135C1 [Oldenlandia corymbosa var. corymbosa]|uniref:OLC1v1011135C1 n=1 Tax=Oldenlandia corymbosa var. corymbosa TaxID=529605 RepID=A0AAV1DTK1_OLDCO|nr:OLC1v1011135C1 [Oldenlandia corymbosa var. corymbosa]
MATCKPFRCHEDFSGPPRAAGQSSCPASHVEGCYDTTAIREGATVLGCIVSDGVMVAVDHGPSSGPIPGNVCVLHSHLLLTYSGGCPLLMLELFKALEERLSLSSALSMKAQRGQEAEVVLWVTKFLAEREDFKADRALLQVDHFGSYGVDQTFTLARCLCSYGIYPFWFYNVLPPDESVLSGVQVLYVGRDGNRQLVSKEEIAEVDKLPDKRASQKSMRRMNRSLTLLSDICCVMHRGFWIYLTFVLPPPSPPSPTHRSALSSFAVVVTSLIRSVGVPGPTSAIVASNLQSLAVGELKN